LLTFFLFLISEIAKREISQAIGMLSSFRNKLNEKRGAAGARAPTTNTARAGLSKSSKKRAREGGNIARTVRALGQMSIPPPSRTVTHVESPPTDDFNRPIPIVVVVPVAVIEKSSLALLGGDMCFTRAMNFNLPPDLKELIGSVPDDDVLNGGVEIIYRGLILTRRGAEARRQHIEDLSRLEHDLQEASNNLQQVVDANTTYEKKLQSWSSVRLGWSRWRRLTPTKRRRSHCSERRYRRSSIRGVSGGGGRFRASGEGGSRG